jgi:hypothetical protein
VIIDRGFPARRLVGVGVHLAIGCAAAVAIGAPKPAQPSPDRPPAGRSATNSSRIEITGDKVVWARGPGPVSLGYVAGVRIPAGWLVTDATGAEKFLQARGLPCTSGEVAVIRSRHREWFGVVEYDAVGASETDAPVELDAAEMSRKLRDQLATQFAGFAENPVYDESRHALRWATQLSEGTGTNTEAVVCHLGRKGVMRFHLLGITPADKDEVAGVLATFSFKPGFRHEDASDSDNPPRQTLEDLVMATQSYAPPTGSGEAASGVSRTNAGAIQDTVSQASDGGSRALDDHGKLLAAVGVIFVAVLAISFLLVRVSRRRSQLITASAADPDSASSTGERSHRANGKEPGVFPANVPTVQINKTIGKKSAPYIYYNMTSTFVNRSLEARARAEAEQRKSELGSNIDYQLVEAVVRAVLASPALQEFIRELAQKPGDPASNHVEPAGLEPEPASSDRNGARRDLITSPVAPV